MEAFGLTHAGAPAVLAAVTVPDSHPQAGEFSFAVRYVGLNNREKMARETAKTGPLTILGSDAVGPITALGPGVTGFRVGQWVAVHTSQADAEEALGNADNAVALPKGVPAEIAAGAITPGITAYRTVHHFAHIEAGQTVIVKGANGAVGSLVVQLATAMGATVIGIAADTHQEAVLEAGASRAVAYDQNALALTLGDAGDVVINAALDGVGSEDDIAMTRAGGQLVTVAHNLPSHVDKAITMTHIRPTQTPKDTVALEAIMAGLAAGDLHITLNRVLPFTLAGLQAGHTLLGQPHSGRIVLSRTAE